MRNTYAGARERAQDAAIIPDGKMSETGSDVLSESVVADWAPKQKVAFDAVFTNKYLPD